MDSSGFRARISFQLNTRRISFRSTLLIWGTGFTGTICPLLRSLLPKWVEDYGLHTPCASSDDCVISWRCTIRMAGICLCHPNDARFGRCGQRAHEGNGVETSTQAKAPHKACWKSSLTSKLNLSKSRHEILDLEIQICMSYPLNHDR